ncbi:hypothetical protein OHQ89_24970 [Streptomyces canus]|uniref:RHS repeat-associated core domain-containing protein n=1 Tax=Streptomyces canus TaxID=58343 RepID=UPI0030E55797
MRYYSAPGGATIVRTGTGTNYGFELAADQHGTNSLYLDNTAQTPTWRQFDPYGNPRGTTTTWPDNRTFLNKTTDTTTGLTDIGAREYDPTLGRFISLDPVFEATSPQELGGYTYSADNPVSSSDPTGLESCGAAHYCSGTNGTYGTYHAENDPGSKKYKGSSHYCDTHKCSSGTAHTSSTTTTGSSGCWPVESCNQPTYKLDVGTSKAPNSPPFLKAVLKELRAYWKHLNESRCTKAQAIQNISCDVREGTFQIGPLEGEEAGPGEEVGPRNPLPEFVEGGPTRGIGFTSSSGDDVELISGNKKNDADLIRIVNNKLRSEGLLPGSSTSTRASDVEQKFAATMIRDSAKEGELFINNPEGPCQQRLGCDNVLDALLGDKKLKVNWPDGNGGWTSKSYGGAG